MHASYLKTPTYDIFILFLFYKLTVICQTMAIKRSRMKLEQNFLRAFLQCFSSCIASTGSRRTNAHSTNSVPSISVQAKILQHKYKTMVVDVEGFLLRSCSTFLYFMVVALEAGGFLRGLLLLLAYPFVCLLGHEMGMRFMVMLTFCGLRKETLVRVGRAVLPKHLLEDVGLQGFEIMKQMNHEHGTVICATRMPRIMVEAFLREYLMVEHVFGRELKMVGGFCTGFMEGEGGEVQELKEVLKDGSNEISASEIVGVSSSTFVKSQLPLASYCKDILLVEKEDKTRWQALPREKYPKPLIFHDGRLAFRPTPFNTFFMFIWLPFGFVLAFLRLAIAILLPYKLSTPVLAMTNMKWRLHHTNDNGSGEKSVSITRYMYQNAKTAHKRGQLFVCNHRTLIDPVYVSVAINQPVHAVCYSVSSLSEMISPISTVRLTRKREQDATLMGELLDRGESVVVCPEGTTCREPYLLRFSPLFTELSDEVVPVAVTVKTSMFYATTAGGWKCFDPLYYLMNPAMCYEVQFLEKIDTSDVRARQCSSIDKANHVQQKIGKALGFQCTMLTRKDKYMILAGTDGIVRKG